MMLGRAYRRCSAALSPPTRFCTVTLGTYFLKASFTFSPALLRLAFAWSPLPCL
jgi:hypothetical protein